MSLDLAVFEGYYSEGRIEQIQLDEISNEIKYRFERYSRQFLLKEEYVEGNFKHLFLISHKTGERTYVATQTKTIEKNFVYLLDFSSENEYLGCGKLVFNSITNVDIYMKKPFVEYTKTEENFRKKGFGLRRLYVMNAQSQMLYSLPLNSGTIFVVNEAKRSWERLVRKGVAKKYMQGDRERFVFIDHPTDF